MNPERHSLRKAPNRGRRINCYPFALARPTGDRKRCTRTTIRHRRSRPPWSPCRRIGDKPVRPQPWPAGLSSGGRHERAPVFLQDDGRSES